MTSTRKIVVAIDHSERDRGALEAALHETLAMPSEIHAMYVVKPARDDGSVLERELERLRAHILGELDTLLEGLSIPRPPDVYAHVAFGTDPAREIVHLAAQSDADLIVLGTHGHRGVKRLLPGSVRERTARLAGCSVITARPKNHALPLDVPGAEPLCDECLRRSEATGGAELWCTSHAARHPNVCAYRHEEPSNAARQPRRFAQELRGH